MKSVALSHFPQVALSGQRYQLLNPILKKRYQHRPEERVRLRWTEFLLNQSGVKRSRIGFETPVKLRQDDHALRADLVIYNDQFEPDVLIECKAEEVRLSGKAAVQAAVYNSKIGAPHLILTNGLEDFRFEYREGKIHENHNPLLRSRSSGSFSRNVHYWSERGFCSSEPGGSVGPLLARLLDDFWKTDDQEQVKYLDFAKSPLPVPMNHYYRIFNFSEDRKLAITFSGHSDRGTYLIVVGNSGGKNDGLLTLSVEGNPSANVPKLRTKDGISEFSPGSIDLFSFVEETGFDGQSFAEALIGFFD